jgi:hypothetical protein
MMHLTQNDYEDSLDIRRKTPKNKSSCIVMLSTKCLLMTNETGSMISCLDKELLTRTTNHILRISVQVFLWIKSKN